jgi:hypothetical protein
MFEVGDLVSWRLSEREEWFAIVLENWTREFSGEEVVLIQWITGRYVEQKDFVSMEDLTKVS